MKELFEQALISYNLPLTIALVGVLFYWVLCSFGALDSDAFDIDFDSTADIDADLDSSSDAHGDHHSGSFIGGVMKFVNAQDVPIMIILSLLVLSMWAISIFSNYHLNPNRSDLVALGLLATNFIVSVFVVKGITTPLRPVMRAIKNDADAPAPIVGSVGVVKSRMLDQNFGQVEVIRDKGAPALVNCRLRDEDEGQMRGSEVLIYDFDAEKDRYLVRALTPSEKKYNSAPKLTNQEQSNHKTKITNNNTPIKE